MSTSRDTQISASAMAIAQEAVAQAVNLGFKASVLREKDIMQLDEVTSPARHIYFPVMMMYLDEAGAERQYDEFATRLTEFMGVVRNPAVLSDCIAISKHVMAREYYKALMLSRKLIEYEDQRLGHVS